MCVIIDKPCGVVLSDEKLEAAASINKDGMGVMYIDPLTSELVVKRWLPKTIYKGEKDIKESFALLKNVHAVFHMRIRTHGDVSFANTHPFQVLNKEEHGRDLYFMHNGMIGITCDTPEAVGMSDTAIFNKYVLQPTLSKCPDLLYTRGFQMLIEEFIGSSKLLFMDDTGKVLRLGNWLTNEECAVSNNNYFHKPAPIVQRSYSQYGWGSTEDEVEFWKDYPALNKPYVPIEATTPRPPLTLVPKQEVVADALARTEFLKEKARETPVYDADDEDFTMYVQVGHTTKHIDEVRLEDLRTLLETNNLDELIEDFPDQIAGLMQELLDYSEALEINATRYNY